MLNCIIKIFWGGVNITMYLQKIKLSQAHMFTNFSKTDYLSTLLPNNQ